MKYLEDILIFLLEFFGLEVTKRVLGDFFLVIVATFIVGALLSHFMLRLIIGLIPEDKRNYNDDYFLEQIIGWVCFGLTFIVALHIAF